MTNTQKWKPRVGSTRKIVPLLQEHLSWYHCFSFKVTAKCKTVGLMF
jgi:hypothetical protein